VEYFTLVGFSRWSKGYSPECVEGEFSEVHTHDAAYRIGAENKKSRSLRRTEFRPFPYVFSEGDGCLREIQYPPALAREHYYIAKRGFDPVELHITGSGSGKRVRSTSVLKK